MTTDLLTVDAGALRRSLLRRLAPELVEEVLAEMRQAAGAPKKRRGRTVSIAESARRTAAMAGMTVDEVKAMRARLSAKT